jgi:ubiquitin-conjugating enzyme E2 O
MVLQRYVASTFALSSRQYSEKAYVLSLSFIRRALEQHPIGLEDELKWFYYTHGRLAKVLQDVRQLVERSSQVPEERFEECLDKAFEESDLAVPLLSQGGIIAASRVIPKLVALAELKER